MSTITIVVEGKDKGASGILGKVGKGIGGLTKVAAGLGAGAVAGIGAVGAGLAKMAIDAAPLEGIKGAFEGVSASFEGGSEAMLSALQQASYGMINNMDLMTSFNQGAQLVSVDFAQNLPDAMQYLGKVSQATGTDMSFMMDSLVKGVGRLSPMILDNLGIQVNLTEANQAYAESVGKSVDELTKAEQQTALMDQVLAKLKVNTADMPDVTGSATMGFESFKVMLQNTTQEIGLALLPITKQIMAALTDFAKNVLPLVVDFIVTRVIPTLQDWWNFTQKNLIPIIKELFAWLQEHLPPAIERLQQFWDTVLRPALERAWAFIQDNVIPILNTLWDWLSTNLPPAIQTLADFWNNTLYPALQAIWEFISVDMLPIWQALADLIKVTVVAAFEILTNFWNETLHPVLKAIWEFVRDKIIPIFSGWADSMGGISGIISGIAGTIQSLTEKISNMAKNMPSWLKPGSPTPFEIGLRGIADAMAEVNRMSSGFATGITVTPIDRQQLAQNQVVTRQTTFQIQANYGYQSEQNLRDDIRILELLYNAS